MGVNSLHEFMYPKALRYPTVLEGLLNNLMLMVFAKDSKN